MTEDQLNACIVQAIQDFTEIHSIEYKASRKEITVIGIMQDKLTKKQYTHSLKDGVIRLDG